MKSRNLALLLAGGLTCLGVCKTSTSNRVVYATQPAVVASSPAPVAVVAPAPVAVAAPAPAPCSTCPNAATNVPPPPPGFAR